ncbi:MAG TPA: acyl-CoA reductase [Pseudonocardia sp.]
MHTIPLIIRGRVIRDDLVTHGGRRGGLRFQTPDVGAHVRSLPLRDPGGLGDLYGLRMSEILDYLDELSGRLSPGDNPHVQQALEISSAVSGMGEPILARMYEGIRNLLCRDRVEEIVGTNIGIPFLEGWVPLHVAGRQAEVRAFGARTVHVNAGNGVAIALQSVLVNAVLRSDAIVKSPSNDPFTATAIALTMIDMAPDHPLTLHLSVAYWPGGDDTVENVLYRPTNIDKIIAWGGAASMRHIRARLRPGIDLIAMDPKNSVSIIGPEVLADEVALHTAAELLARDVGYFNQEGCANSRVAYLLSGTDEPGVKQAVRFGELVHAAVQALPPDLSTPHPAFDPALRDELAGVRLSQSHHVIGGRAAEGGVVVSLDEEPVDFAERLGGRVVNVVPVDGIEDVLPHLTVHTQTVGVYPDRLLVDIRDECARRGVQRLCTLGYACSMGLAQPHDAMEPMRRMVRWIVSETYPDTTVAGSGLGFG